MPPLWRFAGGSCGGTSVQANSCTTSGGTSRATSAPSLPPAELPQAAAVCCTAVTMQSSFSSALDIGDVPMAALSEGVRRRFPSTRERRPEPPRPPSQDASNGSSAEAPRPASVLAAAGTGGLSAQASSQLPARTGLEAGNEASSNALPAAAAGGLPSTASGGLAAAAGVGLWPSRRARRRPPLPRSPAPPWPGSSLTPSEAAACAEPVPSDSSAGPLGAGPDGRR
mmetsp:Transcript_110316/g.356070  ORF Transcript_110316/g.356070 Transcript_110316/m.356070 type:complete len:226 (+) Transcript_110316:661-1338(+)